MLTKSARYFYDNEAIKEPISSSYAADKRAHGVLRQRFYPQSKYVKEGMIELQNGEFPSERRTETRNRRNVWNINTQPYADAHFATFPEELPKICILAGTSAKGCCAKCGSPWERIIERDRIGVRNTSAGDNGQQIHREGVSHDLYAIQSKTIGWQPTCKCKADIEPCVCLDPFAGSGTTGQVAIELGRKAVLIELNPKYVELIRQRCNVTPGLALA